MSCAGDSLREVDRETREGAKMRGDATRYDKILLLTDLTEKSQAALGYARAMAKYYDSDLVLLHVLPPAEPLFSSLGSRDGDDHEAIAVRDRLKAMGKALRAEGRQRDDSEAYPKHPA